MHPGHAFSPLFCCLHWMTVLVILNQTALDEGISGFFQTIHIICTISIGHDNNCLGLLSASTGISSFLTDFRWDVRSRANCSQTWFKIPALNSSQVKIKYKFSKPFPCDCWYVQQSMISHDILTRPFVKKYKMLSFLIKIFTIEDNAFLK